MCLRLFGVVLSAGLLAAAFTQDSLSAQEPTIAAEEGPTIAVEESLVAPPSVVDESVVGGPAIVASDIQPAQTCLPIHVVRDHYSRSAKRTIRCHGAPVQQTLCVENPANCCLYAVNVCVPSCCVDAPVCCGQRVGLLGRGYAVYQWPCGYEVEVVFRVHGGVILKYR